MNRVSAALTLLLGLLLAGTAMAHDTVYYYSSDTVHSEVVITDASRNVVERTNYAPYGQVLNRSLRDGPGYTGHEEDPESGLVYMQQRYYDPASGRFLSNDPVATTDDGESFNRYAYVNDSPYRYTDPDGKESTGEIVADEAQAAADRGYHVETFLWAFTGVVWDVLGAESVSQVADKGSAASTSDKVMAAVTILTLGRGEEAATAGKGAEKGLTYLYQKVSAAGEHLKFGIAKNPATRYTKQELAGGQLRILAKGAREDMLELERSLHETLPIGPEEGQTIYIQKQIDKGLTPPPY
jgi:RHS repeat-associated protein